MIGTVIGAIFVGLIVGALARLILPGRQNIGVVVYAEENWLRHACVYFRAKKLLHRFCSRAPTRLVA